METSTFYGNNFFVQAVQQQNFNIKKEVVHIFQNTKKSFWTTTTSPHLLLQIWRL